MSNSKSILNDEILHFLYSNRAFQQLEEEKQVHFLQTFQCDDLFKEIIEVTMSLQDTILEVEATMPKMQDKDFLLPPEQHKKLLKEQIKVEGNVYFVPFENFVKQSAPFIICIQQSKTMMEFNAFCKGLILPLFNVCTRQKRDLIIIPFDEHRAEPILFECGLVDTALFKRFIHWTGEGEAKIVPALQRAVRLFVEDEVKISPELMIITDNQFTDFHEMIAAEFTTQFVELETEVTVVAISEEDFEIQPILFADKVFFTHD